MSNTRILLVEDEIPVAESIKISLKSLGYTVPAIASSKEEALQQAAEVFPDSVLMDIHLDRRKCRREQPSRQRRKNKCHQLWSK